jgi:RimJ/RimL family protein N-acetyltransferase
LSTVRIADLADAEAIARVQVASWQAAYAGLMPAAVLSAFTVERRVTAWRAILARDASPDARTFVATNRAVVGFASTGSSRDPDAAPWSSELYALYLHPSVWGQGVGRALFDAAVADLCARGRREVTAWVLAGNARALRFYEAAGMRLDGGHKVEVMEGAQLPHVRCALALADVGTEPPQGP